MPHTFNPSIQEGKAAESLRGKLGLQIQDSQAYIGKPCLEKNRTKGVIYYNYVFPIACKCVCNAGCTDIREQLVGVSSFLPPCRFEGLDSGHNLVVSTFTPWTILPALKYCIFMCHSNGLLNFLFQCCLVETLQKYLSHYGHGRISISFKNCCYIPYVHIAPGAVFFLSFQRTKNCFNPENETQAWWQRLIILVFRRPWQEHC